MSIPTKAPEIGFVFRNGDIGECTVTTEHHLTDEPPNNRPQDGRVCKCEDAPCCGHYEL